MYTAEQPYRDPIEPAEQWLFIFGFRVLQKLPRGRPMKTQLAPVSPNLLIVQIHSAINVGYS